MKTPMQVGPRVCRTDAELRDALREALAIVAARKVERERRADMAELFKVWYPSDWDKVN